MKRWNWDGRYGKTVATTLSPLEQEIASIAGGGIRGKGLRMMLRFAHENWPQFAQWMVDNKQWLDVRAHAPADEGTD